MDRSRARSDVYSMLCIAFSYPRPPVFSMIMGGQWQEALRKSLTILDESFFVEILDDIRNGSNPERGVSQREMADEYERLLGVSLPVRDDVPDALFWMSTQWSALREDRNATDISAGEFEGTFSKTRWPLADIMCHRFKFMGILAELESNAECSEKIRMEELQLNFVSRFIVPCIPDFCDTLIKNSNLDFYRDFGILIREFIKFEENYLGIPEEMDTS